MMGVIYSLNDPVTNSVRYVGQSINPHSRLQSHLNNAKNNPKSCRSSLWINSLLADSLVPVMDILESDIEDKYLNEREIYWIKHCRHSGCLLLNHNDGGFYLPRSAVSKAVSESNKQRVWTTEQRHRIGEGVKKRKISEETRRKMSVAMRERFMRDGGAHLARIRPMRDLSTGAFSEKLKNSWKGRSLSQKQREALRSRCLIWEFKGKSMTPAEWSTELNIPYTTLKNRHRKGMPVEEILSTPHKWKRKRNTILVPPKTMDNLNNQENL